LSASSRQGAMSMQAISKGFGIIAHGPGFRGQIGAQLPH
jgi:hypothetical protein